MDANERRLEEIERDQRMLQQQQKALEQQQMQITHSSGAGELTASHRILGPGIIGTFRRLNNTAHNEPVLAIHLRST
jgi:hypothetical protein